MENIRLKYENLPTTIKAFCIQSDGFYTIVVNARLDFDAQKKAIQHELNHIRNEDFDLPSYSLAEFLNEGGC